VTLADDFDYEIDLTTTGRAEEAVDLLHQVNQLAIDLSSRPATIQPHDSASAPGTVPPPDGISSPVSSTDRYVPVPFTDNKPYAQPVGNGWILHNVSVEDYYADRLPLDIPPTLSASVAKVLVSQTPAHARLLHAKLRTPEESADREDDTTVAKTKGTLIHRLVLGAGGDLVEIDYPSYSKKDAQQQRDRALDEHKIPVLKHVLREMRKSAEMILLRLRSEGIELDGESEVPMVWRETALDGTVVYCRGLVDHIWLGESHIMDLKTIQSADQDSCEKSIASYDYDIQSAAYSSGLKALQPDMDPTFDFAFCEVEAPNSVTVGTLDGLLQHEGEKAWAIAVNRWAKALATKEFHASYVTGRARFEHKAWKIQERARFK
jgi:hypothetical protein